MKRFYLPYLTLGLGLSLVTLATPMAEVLDTAQDTTQQAGPASLLETLLPAESPALRERLLHPERLFLWTGGEAVGPGETFTAEPSWTRRLLWAGQVYPFAEWPSLSEKRDKNQDEKEEMPSVFSLQGGGEMDEQDGGAWRGDLSYSVLPQLRLRGLLWQNEVASAESRSRRAQALAPKSGKNVLSFYGDRLPSQAYALGEMTYRQRSGSLHATYAQGWRWGLSPVTGAEYPWEIRLTRLKADYGPGQGIYLLLAQWESPEEALHYQGEGQASEVGLRFQGGEDGWSWYMQWGFARRKFEAGPAGGFPTFDEDRFPFTLLTQKNFTSEDFPGWAWRTESKVASSDGILSLEGESSLGRTQGQHRPDVGVKAYLSYRSTDLPASQEIAADSAQTVFGDFFPDRTARGGAAFGEYAFVRGPETAKARATWAAEWGRPVFSSMTSPSLSSVEQGDYSNAARVGNYAASPFVLHNLALTAQMVSTRLPGIRLALNGGTREFFGEEAGDLEYAPAPWWAGAEAAWAVSPDFSLTGLAQWVGEKVVRRWPKAAGTISVTQELRSKPHAEISAGLRRTFFQQKFGANLQLLNAVQPEAVEHPAGNALGLRMLASVDGRW